MNGPSRRIVAYAALAVAVAPAVVAEGVEMEERVKSAFAAGELSGLHGVIADLGDERLGEVYFSGEDEAWGRPLGEVAHGPETLHDLRSVTKSVVSLLYGVALSEGLVPGLDEPLIDHFPEYSDLAADADRRRILVRHALSMTMGTEWDEIAIPYTDPKNSEIAMEMADDRYRFVLDRPIVDPPGTRWVYNGGATAVIARLIEKGAGERIDAYAEKKLFAPLGVDVFEWPRGKDGAPSAASGLRLRLPDLAKIGAMVAARGLYDGRRIMPEDWLDISQSPHAWTDEGLRYGFFWWLAPPRLYGEELEYPLPVWAAGFGNGGQRLSIGFRSNVVVAISAGNYNQPDAWRLPAKIVFEIVNPVVNERLSRAR